MSSDKFSKDWEEMREEYSPRDPFKYDLAAHYLNKWLRDPDYTQQTDPELRAETLRIALDEMKFRYFLTDEQVERVKARALGDDEEEQQ